ncbi:hypothetical protein N7G274_007033 [Stereocaulon virgatum]|uniref:Uncharacterized protein n=1 Tax=Stereocaulon virgatum TaxID=373712 RepID=A0ABR4A2N7_9LECA
MKRRLPTPPTSDTEEDCISPIELTNLSSVETISQSPFENMQKSQCPVETKAQTQSSGKLEEQRQSPLLRLPAELRNKIYEYALTEEDPISYRNPLGVAILRTNRKIYGEAKHIYHMANTFVIGDDFAEDERWLQRMRKEPTQKIKYMHAGGNMYMCPGTRPMFDLLAQCSNLNLTMEAPVNVLWRLFLSGYLRNLHGFSSITSTRTCEGKRTKPQVHWWELWQGDLQQVKDHLVSSCPETCTLHAERERLNSKCVVHLHILHCCLEAHCCTL